MRRPAPILVPGAGLWLLLASSLPSLMTTLVAAAVVGAIATLVVVRVCCVVRCDLADTRRHEVAAECAARRDEAATETEEALKAAVCRAVRPSLSRGDDAAS